MIRWVALLALLLAVPAVTSAQQSRTVSLSITNGGVSMQNPTLADYDAGFIIDETPLSWTVTVYGPRSNCTYASTISVRASSSTIGNGKSISAVSWSSGGVYTPLTTSSVTIGTVNLSAGNTSDAGTLTFRILLDWKETSASYLGSSLLFEVSTTTSGSGC